MSGLSRGWIIGIVIGAIALIGLVYFMFFRGGSSGTSQITPTPETTVEEPTATPVPELAKEDIKVRILNGSGVVGEANRVKAIVEKAGFTVESTDNAKSYDHKETDIQTKKVVSSSILDELKELLGKDYTVATSELSEDEEVDIIITVGARINAPTIAPKPTTSKLTPTAATSGGVTPSPTSQLTPTPTPTKST